jgi:hypothetical protein
LGKVEQNPIHFWEKWSKKHSDCKIHFWKSTFGKSGAKFTFGKTFSEAREKPIFSAFSGTKEGFGEPWFPEWI